MLKSTIRFICLLVCVACTKPSEPMTETAGAKGTKASSKLSILPYDSPIQYVHGPMDSPEYVASIEGVPVSWAQLISNEPALLELEQRWVKAGIKYTNDVVNDLIAQKKLPPGNAEINFHFPEPSGDLSGYGVVNSESIRTRFSGTLKPGTIATVGNLQITEEELLKASLTNLQLYERLFALRMDRLNGIVIRQFLLSASKEAGLSMEDFVKSKVLVSDNEVNDKMISTFAKDKGIPDAELTVEMKKRLRAILGQTARESSMEAYVAKNWKGNPVQVAFLAPNRVIRIPKLSDSVPYWGDRNGTPLLYAGHWSCKDCKESLKFFLESKGRLSSTIRGTFLYSFSERDREARMSAEAGLCLHNQNADYFWKFIEASLDVESPNTEVAINEAAKTSGADFKVFRKCFLSREYKKSVDNQLKMVAEIGIQRPPLMALDGKIIKDLAKLEKIAKTLGTNDLKREFSSEKASKAGFFRRIFNFIGSFF